MNNSNGIQSLIDLGLSDLEARVYIFLLSESPSTAYKIAKNLGKPVSNVYGIIGAMEKKKLVLVDDSEKRLCRAVPPEDLLLTMEFNFKKLKHEVEEFIESIAQPMVDNRVYRLSTPDQVFARAETMLSQCQKTAYVDAFPKPMERLNGVIHETAARGIKMAVHTYEKVKIPSAMVVMHRHSERIMKTWQGQWLTMATDSNQLLLAYMSANADEVLHAVWSPSPTVSWAFHSNAYSDLILSALVDSLSAGMASDDILKKYSSILEEIPYPDVPESITPSNGR